MRCSAAAASIRHVWLTGYSADIGLSVVML